MQTLTIKVRHGPHQGSPHIPSKYIPVSPIVSLHSASHSHSIHNRSNWVAEVEQKIDCAPDPCPVDCVLSSWTGWSPCDKTCGPGTSTRIRFEEVIGLRIRATQNVVVNLCKLGWFWPSVAKVQQNRQSTFSKLFRFVKRVNIDKSWSSFSRELQDWHFAKL